MTSNNDKHPIKRQCSDEFPLNLKIYSQEDPEKMNLFFNSDHSQYKSELQMPIKIQGNSRLSHSLKRERRIYQQAHQSSEHIILNDPYSNHESKHEHFNLSKENPKDQSQMLIHPLNKFDQLESLQLPLYDLNSHVQYEVNHYGFQDEYSIKIEENDEDYDIFLNQIQERGYHQDAKRYQQRRAIYNLMNKFRAFHQTSSICANSQRLIRKDSLSKMRSNILTVLTKQNKKLFVELQKQKLRVEEMIERPKSFSQRMKQAEKTEGNDQLFKTGLQDEEFCIKQRIFEMASENDEK